MPADPIAIVRRREDGLARRPAVDWAIGELRAAVEAKAIRVDLLDEAREPDRTGIVLTVADSRDPGAERILRAAGVSVPDVPEALGLVRDASGGGRSVLACGSDERGLIYAVLELADRVAHAADPSEAVAIDSPVVERPANQVRSVARCFASETDDKPWFQDEDWWRRYLSMLVAQRFNRLNLMVGLGYNFHWHITDSYLYFPYPFLVDLPGYGVRVPQLLDEERERNLHMVRFASREAVARGLDFQFGIWTHAYEWIDSPEARYTIEGLTPDRHAAYCRDALQALLEACPDIGGLTIRTHGESGIPERSWDFWKTVLDGVARCGRRVRLDLHPKGLDAETLEIALATGMPITLSPKYAAEHMGLPYHQAAIRELDRPPTDRDQETTGKAAYMNVCEGSRPFTRYSYADFLREDRPYDVVFRIWPGTQRVLLWGDPAMASGFGRLASIAGSQGIEWADPLSLKGREGTALPGPRDGYADLTLSPADDWDKYAYTYRLFGRLTYDPDADPETWRRHLRSAYGPVAAPAERALASASRILPLVTMAHHPSASNNYYWPEVYTDIGIVGEDGSVETHYYDTPEPKRFGTVGPLDPEVFAGAEGSVREALEGRPSGRYSPLDVGGWLERLSDDALEHLARIEAEAPELSDTQIRRLVTDVAIQAALGRFFAGKMRAAVGYELFTATGDQAALQAAADAHHAARTAWTTAVDRASGVYVDDLTYGPQSWLRGTWSDRLPAIDADLDAMTELARSVGSDATTTDPATDWAMQLLTHGSRGPVLTHRPPDPFVPGDGIRIALDVDDATGEGIAGVSLRYRHVDQSKLYEQVEMERGEERYVATIDGRYSDSPYAMQYLFVVRDTDGRAWLHPGLDADLSNQPYYVIRQRPQPI
ncbi:MAG TPA: hypothetical protein VFR44_06105 [Actinomycetota bacterium]|nr:hypothetical protein [Actinomycetota bacterium]